MQLLLDPFEIRRRELIREKEVTAEVEKRLATLIPQKIEEEIALRKEKLRQDIVLEIEQEIRKECEDLRLENEALKEVRVNWIVR